MAQIVPFPAPRFAGKEESESQDAAFQAADQELKAIEAELAAVMRRKHAALRRYKALLTSRMPRFALWLAFGVHAWVLLLGSH